MILPIGQLKYNDRIIKFNKRSHTNVSREGNGFSRDQFMNDSRYMIVFKEAMHNGLMSFGIYKKEMIKISFVDSWGTHMTILAERREDEVLVHTMYTSKKNPFWKHFPKIHNSINLVNGFVLPAMTKAEYFESKRKSKMLDHDIKARNEAPVFLQAMKHSGIRKVF